MTYRIVRHGERWHVIGLEFKAGTLVISLISKWVHRESAMREFNSLRAA